MKHSISNFLHDRIKLAWWLRDLSCILKLPFWEDFDTWTFVVLEKVLLLSCWLLLMQMGVKVLPLLKGINHELNPLTPLKGLVPSYYNNQSGRLKPKQNRSKTKQHSQQQGAKVFADKQPSANKTFLLCCLRVFALIG